VVAKLLDASVLHKSDIGAVHVGIHDAQQLDAALDSIDAAAPSGAPRYLIEAQAPAGRELIVGARRDPSFGPVVLLGMGGVDVEVDAAPILRLGPLTTADARAMVNELPAAVLEGTRGQPQIPSGELASLLQALGQLLAQNPHVSEAEINPLRVTADGLQALDALILVEGAPYHGTAGGTR
jgi:acetyltransferase